MFFEVENRSRGPEYFQYDQLAVGWDDKYVTHQLVDASSIEVPEGETAEFALTYPLSEIETIDSIGSPDDVRILYTEDGRGFPAPLLGGPSDREEAEDFVDADVSLSELWAGSFDDSSS